MYSTEPVRVDLLASAGRCIQTVLSDVALDGTFSFTVALLICMHARGGSMGPMPTNRHVLDAGMSREKTHQT